MTRSQETFELEDGSAIRLSTKSYLTANGVDLSLSGGVIPTTIIHNSDPNTVGTTSGTLGDSDGTASMSGDEQLMAALKYLS
jgi:C-terminal processing protease CtpA/Prc